MVKIEFEVKSTNPMDVVEAMKVAADHQNDVGDAFLLRQTANEMEQVLTKEVDR